MTDDELRMLDEAQQALRKIARTMIAVHPLLDTPFTDAPDVTPWDRFVKAPSSRCYDLGHEIRRYLRSVGREPLR